MMVYDDVWLDDGLRIRQEGRLGDHGLRHAEGPVLARVGVPARAHGAAHDLSTELDNDVADDDACDFVVMMVRMMC